MTPGSQAASSVALSDAGERPGPGLVGPSYDCYWNHQRPPHPVEVRGLTGPKPATSRRRSSTARACSFPRSTLDAVGMLDSETFAPVGYGADLDYGLRVRSRR